MAAAALVQGMGAANAVDAGMLLWALGWDELQKYEAPGPGMGRAIDT